MSSISEAALGLMSLNWNSDSFDAKGLFPSSKAAAIAAFRASTHRAFKVLDDIFCPRWLTKNKVSFGSAELS